MRWTFGNSGDLGGLGAQQGGSIQESGLIGVDGEFYFSPSRPAKLKATTDVCSKSLIIPILPYPNIIVPGGSEKLNVFEMRNRYLLNEVNDGIFGLSFHSQQAQKLSLVGILAKMTNRKLMDDGRVSGTIEGIQRFYLEEIVSDKPYIKAKVRPFKDCTENPDLLEKLEWDLVEAFQTNMKMMGLLYPAKSFTPANYLLQNRPLPKLNGVRPIVLSDDKYELPRRAKFSFAVIDSLQIPPSARLALMQEHVLERRLAKCLNYLKKGEKYIRDELVTKAISTDEELDELRRNISRDLMNDTWLPKPDWVPENFVAGNWVQMATMM